MNSTKLHSLSRDACRRNGSQRLWFATLESKETNKREGKNQAGTLQGRRCRQRVQRGTHAGCGGFQRAGKTGEAPGAWQQREKERKRKRKRQLGRRIELGSGGAERADERC